MDPVVPSDAMILQVVGYVKASSNIYKANVYCSGVQKKSAPPCWILRDVLDRWAGEGKSQCHTVCAKK